MPAFMANVFYYLQSLTKCQVAENNSKIVESAQGENMTSQKLGIVKKVSCQYLQFRSKVKMHTYSAQYLTAT